MTTYLLRRLLLMVPTLFGISVIVFALIQFVPGGPVEQAIQRMRGIGGGGGEAGRSGGGFSGGMTQAAIDELKAYYGFDEPLVVRYAKWVSNVVRLDFGKSYNYREPVWDLIRRRIPVSLAIAGTGFLLAYAVSIPLGVFKAIHHRTWKDTFTSIAVFLGLAIPEFALGMLLLVLFGGGSLWNVFPLSGLTSDGFESMSAAAKAKDVLHHLALPLFCYALGSFATLTMLVKNSVIENIQADYVRTALAKGLTFRAALWKHALRNSLIPVATGFGNILKVLIASTLLIEVVFGIRGMGLLSFEAVNQRDYPVTLAIIMVGALLTLLGNLLSDVLYVLIDPRISFASAS